MTEWQYDPAEAARQIAKRKAQLHELMLKVPKKYRHRWCKNGACGCLGCVQMPAWGILKAGFTEQQHAEWMREHPDLW
jgi:hypothetical protein